MTIFGNLEIGKSSLNAAQMGQTTSGHNIANANTPGYSRQRVDQSAETGRYTGGNYGVRIDGIGRFYNQFNSEKVIDEQSKLSDWKSRESYLQAIESIYQDIDGNNLGKALGDFWNAWSAAATQPESQAERQNLLVVAQDLIAQFKAMDKRLADMQASLNQEMIQQMQEVNALGQQIADLNKQIHRVEASLNPANDLKDQREEAMIKLAEKIDIHWFYNKEGQIDINLPQGAALVRGVSAYSVEPYLDPVNPELAFVGYKIAPSVLMNISPSMKAGSLNAVERIRDDVVGKQRSELQILAKSLVDAVNEHHAAGHGLVEPYHQILSAYPLSPEQVNEPISGLQSGEISLELVPDSELEEVITLTVPINAGEDSLQTVVAKINQAAENIRVSYKKPNFFDAPPKEQKIGLDVAPVVGNLTADNRLRITANRGFSFRFGQDTSRLFAKLGLHSFMEMQENIADMRVNPFLQEDAMQISLGKAGNPGDNSIALAVHDLQFEKRLNNATATFDEFYRYSNTAVGLASKKAQENSVNHQNIFDQYLAMKKSVTGVNIDEEMTNMIKYQKAYEASAKYISTIDSMTETLINM